MSSENRELEELPRVVLPAIPQGFEAMKAFSRTGSDLLIQHMGPTFTTLVEGSGGRIFPREPEVEVLGFGLSRIFKTSVLSEKVKGWQRGNPLLEIDTSLARFHQALVCLPAYYDLVLTLSGNANLFFFEVEGVIRTVSGRRFSEGWKLAHLNGGFVSASDNDIEWMPGDRFFIFKLLK